MRIGMLGIWALAALVAGGMGAGGWGAAEAKPKPAAPADKAVAPAPDKSKGDKPAKGDKPKADGYLGADGIPNSITILPPPPVKGSPDDQRDRAVYASTRAMAGTARWAMAASDSVRYIAAFDCALGLKLEDGPPEVLKVLGRAGRDASTITNLAKDHYKIPRPFVGNTDTICVEKDRSGLTGSPSYPSGHATFSWTAGLILAELAPEHATDILARARAFGESRVVCGVHTVSDIEEGRTNGSALVAVLHSDPEFRADMEAARTALRAAMAASHAAPDAAQCKVETDAEVHTPWVNPDTAK